MNFTEVATNTRTDYDLKHQGNGRFSVSEDIFNRLNLNENGFVLLEDEETGILALKLVPNDRSKILKGTKGRNFNNKVLAQKLEQSNIYVDNEFEFEQRLEEVGDDVYILTPHINERHESPEIDGAYSIDDYYGENNVYEAGHVEHESYYNEEEQQEITNH